MIRSVCFTGNRPEKLQSPYQEDSSQMQLMKKVLRWELEELVKQGAKDFYTGMAQGIDLIAAEQLLALGREGITLTAVIPFRGQAAGWEQFWRDRYERVLSQCSRKIVLAEHYTPQCFQKRNAFMVEHSDLVLAVIGGKSQKQRGGSWQTVRIALRQGKPVQAIFLQEQVITTQLLSWDDLPAG